ncbi:MAG: Na+/H+ antiporter NhaA [Zetaproteobacteria bacterium]|nr:MAG: Na+/H+ antiporter NhaA [Zetaproteobacteria bacterium]
MKYATGMFDEFINKEAAGGLMLIVATVFALLCANSMLAHGYHAFLHAPIALRVGSWELEYSLYHWVNDGLMAVFFFLVGLEVKRELLEGHLSSLRQVVLPGIAALGGMLVPALIYVLFNAGDSLALQGWAIPTATDIAFALGILALLGSRVPLSLKVFLMALAIIDDLGAILIIALFYAARLSGWALLAAGVALLVLVVMNRLGVIRKAGYVLVGILLWLSVLKSGVHATLAGVALAFTVPLRGLDQDGRDCSPLREIEHHLHGWVAYLILPLFAFVNAGVNLSGFSFSQLMQPVPMGILVALFLGKQLGVFGFGFMAIRLGWARLPAGSDWIQFYGVSVLTGIGFTMSLFITSLAFARDDLFQYTDKLAILCASLLSGGMGYALLRFMPRARG